MKKKLLVIASFFILFFFNFVSIETSEAALPDTKPVYLTTIWNSNYIKDMPTQYYYNDGVYSGWIPRVDYQDWRDREGYNGFLLEFRGNVSRVAIPTRIDSLIFE